MSYRDYSDDLLLALYRLHKERGPERYIEFADIHSKAGIEVNSFYLPRFTEEWQDYYLELSKHLGPHASWSARMKPSGYDYVEESLLSLDDEDDQNAPAIELRDEVLAELVPAADRMVPLDHNSADYKAIADGLRSLREEIRTANNLDCAPEERERLVASMGAAEKLWEAAQLKVIQIKVGIVIAVEDTLEALAKVSKAVGAGLLVDLIKSFVRSKTGIDI